MRLWCVSQPPARNGVALIALPPLRRVTPDVRGLRRHRQILRAVVALVAIDVMHNLPRLKVTT
jgi:hypothetical protein